MAHRSRRVFAPSLAFLVPAAVGGLLAVVAERTSFTALLLFAEPGLLALGLYLSGVLLFRRHVGTAAALVAGLLGGGMLVRLPVTPVDPEPPADEDALALGSCSPSAVARRAPVRMLVWTVRGEGARNISDIAVHQPDIAAIAGDEATELADGLAAVLDGEARHWPGMSLVVRGTFRSCGMLADAWERPLPASRGAARFVLAFPEVDGLGVVPVLAVRLDSPGGPGDWLGWPDRLSAGARRVAAVAHAIEWADLVVVGDFEAPGTFRALGGLLSGSGLSEVSLPPSWPAHVGPVPFLPLHRLDRVFVGPAWVAGSARALPSIGTTRAPLLVDLDPNEGQAAN